MRVRRGRRVKSAVVTGDCLQALAEMDEASVDAIVTDPPYELGFMGKAWDAAGVAYSVDLWRNALRVLKPGGHLLAFGGTRTYHRLTCAIEDAGFEIRDCLAWMYATGFPKSLNVGKAIDKANGTVKVIGEGRAGKTALGQSSDWNKTNDPHRYDITEANSEAAKQWEGWGTALKPAHEPIVLARKPLTGTVAANVQEHGTGALNIDGCRIGFSSEADREESTAKNQHEDFGTPPMTGNTTYGDYSMVKPKNYDPPGRWPANVVLDEAAGEILDEQSGISSGTERRGFPGGKTFGGGEMKAAEGQWFGDTGGASRFFYCAKTSKAERNAGLDGFAPKKQDDSRKEGNPGGDNPRNRGVHKVANHHPTVKPIDLMRWLVRLVTPPSGIVLDPFLGSGTTGIAAHLEGFDFVGIEREPEYAEIARARLAHWSQVEPGTETKAALRKPKRKAQLAIDSGAA